jgi:hypothetical protein
MSNCRLPIRIEILSSAENVCSLDNDLHKILVDASDSCEYNAFVDKGGVTRVKIQCTINEEEKQYAWTQLRLKHATDCSLSAEPSRVPANNAQSYTDTHITHEVPAADEL